MDKKNSDNQNASGKKVLVAMSGGVDSSVAAAMLLEAGYDVAGVYMYINPHRSSDQQDAQAGIEAAAKDAKAAAGSLGIPLHVLDLREKFTEVIDYFASEYANGRTPNPCVYCNRLMKFGKLAEFADSLGIEHFATGHYARVVQRDGKTLLGRAKSQKDQVYALFYISPEVLPRIVLPLGEFSGKAKVRKLAKQLGLSAHSDPDSQEVCFVPDDDYVAFLEKFLPKMPQIMVPGRIISTTGEQLGTHDGFARFTIGQRRGLRVAAGVAMYVTRIDPASGDVTLGTREEVCGTKLSAAGANWHARPPCNEFNAIVQIRYNHRGGPARVKITGETTFDVEFSQPVHAITPGQAAVVFDGDILLGGGWIEQDADCVTNRRIF